MSTVKSKEKIKLNAQEYDRLKQMLVSPDKENHAVALGVLEHCDVEASLPLVLSLYKLTNEKVEGGWAKGSPELMKNIKKAGVTLDGKLTMNKLWSLIKKDYSVEDKQIVLDEFAVSIQEHLTSWGFTLLKDTKLVLKEK